MQSKYIFIIAFTIVFLFGSNWVFNHLNPWTGLIMGITGFILIIKLTIKQLKKDEKSKQSK